MNVYKEDTDEFDPEYLAYLDTLTSEAGEAKYRISRNPQGEIVRMEFWAHRQDNPEIWAYYNFPLPGWMKP